MTITKVGERVRAAREAKKLSLEALAKKLTDKGLKTAPATLGKIERGDTKLPRRDLLMRLADELEVSAAYLLFGLEDLEHLSKEAIEFAIAYSKLSEEQKAAIAGVLNTFKENEK